MKRRYQYVLLFCVPALLAAIIISFILFGFTAGALWLFVFGDEPWPAIADNVLVALFIIVCMTSWLAFLSFAYATGKKQETLASFNSKHLLAAAGATALLVILAVSYQWRAGNIGAISSGALCSDFCQDKGYAASGMPPGNTGVNTCSCFDAQGREAVIVPMSDVTVQQSK